MLISIGKSYLVFSSSIVKLNCILLVVSNLFLVKIIVNLNASATSLVRTLVITNFYEASGKICSTKLLSYESVIL